MARAEWIALLLIALLAAVPRFWLLDVWPGEGSDQTKVGLLAYRFVTYGEISWNPNIGYIGPIQTLVVAAMRLFLGTSVWTLRVPVAIMAVLAVPVVWGMMRRLCGRAAGLVAAVLVATYPWLIISSRYALDPMWLVLPNAVLIWALVRYLQSGRSWALIATMAAAGLGLCLHPAQLVVLPGLCVCLIWGWIVRAVRFRPLAAVLSVIVFLLLAAPVLPYHLDALLGRQKVAAQKLGVTVQAPLDYLGPAIDVVTCRQQYRYFGGEMPPDSGGQAALGAILAFGLLAGGAVLCLRGGLPGRVLSLYWLCGVVVGYFFCSGMNRLAIQGHFRYLICLAMLLPVLWTGALVGLIAPGRWRWPRLIMAIGLGVALMVLPAQLGRYYFGARTRTGGQFDTYRSYQRDPKQLAAQYILNNRLDPNTTLILAQDYDLYYPLRFFLNDGYHIQTLNSEPFIPLNDQFPFQALRTNPNAEWILAIYSQSRLGSQIAEWFAQLGLLRSEDAVYEVHGPGDPALPVLTLYRISPSPVRNNQVARALARGDIHHQQVQGRVPPSGTGKIPRPTLGPPQPRT